MPAKRAHPSQRRQGRPQAGDGDATRVRIIDAALFCFGNYGYRETSNRMVADRADVTTGTIYHYFGSKSDLFREVHEITQRDIQARLADVKAEDFGLSESIEKMFAIFSILKADRPQYTAFNSIVRFEEQRNPEIASTKIDDDWRELYKKLAARGVKRGEIKSKDTRALELVLDAIVLGISQLGSEHSLEESRECLRGFSLLFKGELLRAA